MLDVRPIVLRTNGNMALNLAFGGGGWLQFGKSENPCMTEMARIIVLSW